MSDRAPVLPCFIAGCSRACCAASLEGEPARFIVEIFSHAQSVRNFCAPILCTMHQFCAVNSSSLLGEDRADRVECRGGPTPPHLNGSCDRARCHRSSTFNVCAIPVPRG